LLGSAASLGLGIPLTFNESATVCTNNDCVDAWDPSVAAMGASLVGLGLWLGGKGIVELRKKPVADGQRQALLKGSADTGLQIGVPAVWTFRTPTNQRALMLRAIDIGW